MDTNKIIVLGDIPTPNGQRYKQGYVVYDSKGISCNITAQTGGLGGSSGLYLVRRNNARNNKSR